MANGVEPAADLINALIRCGEAAFERLVFAHKRCRLPGPA